MGVTLLFPGQGSQYIGMGKSLEGTPHFKRFEEADQCLDFKLSKLMFEGPEEELTLTQNTQPAIVSYSCALFDQLKKFLDEKNVTIDRVLGHSVGEYAALYAAGVLPFTTVVRAVNLRGQFMQQAVPVGIGKMIALLKASEESVREACKQASTPNSVVMPANFNDPSQIVISGHAEACDRAVEWLQKNTTSFRSIPLKVSAPFHSSLMKPAAEKLQAVFAGFTFSPNKIAYTANVDAKDYASGTSPSTIQENLLTQLYSSVLWTQSIAKLPNETLAIEVGPGKVLAGLVKKINPQIKVISLDQENAYNLIQEALS